MWLERWKLIPEKFGVGPSQEIIKAEIFCIDKTTLNSLLWDLIDE